MKCWNCNTEMKKFPNMRGLRQVEPMIILDDDYEENGSLFGRYSHLNKNPTGLPVGKSRYTWK